MNTLEGRMESLANEHNNALLNLSARQQGHGSVGSVWDPDCRIRGRRRRTKERLMSWGGIQSTQFLPQILNTWP
jgi:hypothetical protein